MAVIGFSPSVEPPAPGARNESTSPCSKSGWSSRPRARARPLVPVQLVICRQPSLSTVAARSAVAFQRSMIRALRGTDTLYCRNLKRPWAPLHPDEDAPGPPDHARRDPGGGDRRRARGDPGRVDADHAPPVGDLRVDGVDLPREAREAGAREVDDHADDLRVARDAEVGGRERGRCARREREREQRREEAGERQGPGGEGGRHGPKAAPRGAGASRPRPAPGLPAPARAGILRRHAVVAAHTALPSRGLLGLRGLLPR